MKREGWLDVRERGAVWGIRFVVWLCTVFGRGLGRAVLVPICAYYVLSHRTARRASREYLARVHGRATLGMVYRHVLRFAHCALDRLFLLRGRTALFDVESFGTEHLRAQQESGKGALLLGAHLGSFDAMRAKAADRNYRVNILAYFRNAKMINEALHAMDPGTRARLLEIEPGSVDFLLTARERIEAGEFVAVLGDRVGEDHKKSVEVPFLGGVARFPVGPYLFAAAMKCPVFLTFGIFREPNRYELFCEPFADVVTLDRKDREGSLKRYAARYAERLEHYCRLAPDNWFNFYDFWGAE